MFMHSAISVCSRSPLSLRQGVWAESFAAQQLDHFDALWNQPEQFVEPVNYRRNGWSGVSIVHIPDGHGGTSRFFLKRQENQTRVSWRHPVGALTYQYEVDALLRADRQHWPCVELVAFGFRRNGARRQGVVLTRAIDYPALSSHGNDFDWSPGLPALRKAGKRLLAMHRAGWQHGALFPVHWFVNLHSGESSLIDFERARRRAHPALAAEADLTQLLRRCRHWPDIVLEELLYAHMQCMPSLVARLRRGVLGRHHHRAAACNE